MRILGKQWQDGYLDYSLSPGHFRVQVRVWKVLSPIEGMYFIPRRHWRLIWNYLREVGPKQVVQKILSRRKEALRNHKFVSCGLGTVIEAGGDAFSIGQPVVFLAPSHPRCVERVTAPGELLKFFETPESLESLSSDAIALIEAGGDADDWGSQWRGFAGWTEFSGDPLDAAKALEVLSDLEPRLLAAAQGPHASLESPREAVVREASEPKGDARPGQLSAVVFGYGQYAKTNVISNMHPGIRLDVVHEIDPCQIGVPEGVPFGFDTSAKLRSAERHDVCFIAGYHHTHAGIAVEALRRGAAAVVEKPVATTDAQLEELMSTLRDVQGARMFSGFQRRYTEFNGLALEDLGTAPGDPISYHCLIYQVPLPLLHWYRWPNSGSRILCNGTHWLDHFLFLNEFAEVASSDAWMAGNGDLLASVELANGANFSMSLSDHGSSRIGMREHVELRTGDTTVQIQNFTSYQSENSWRPIRRSRVNKMLSYARMYEQISQRIVDGAPGDSIESIESSSSLALELEGKLQAKRSRSGSTEPATAGST